MEDEFRRLANFVREQIAIDLRAHHLDDQQSIGQRALAGAFDLSGSTIQPAALFGTMSREVAAVGETLCGAIETVLSSMAGEPNEPLSAKLLGIFDEEFDAISALIQSEFAKNWHTLKGGTGANERFRRIIADVRRQTKQKIQLMVEKMGKDDHSRESSRISIKDSQIGFLQAGTGNVARVGTISIGAADASKVMEILHQIEERLSSLEGISENDRSELREITRDAAAELAKPKPSGMKLRGSIFAVATAIQTIAALKDLYDALAPYLPAFGLHLGAG